jgi:hypothetical protein
MFDPNLIPAMFGDVVPMVIAGVIALIGLRWFLRSSVGEAIAERIRARTQRGLGDPEASHERVQHLEQQVETLQQQLAEVAERVDFAERLLAERRERKLSAGS